MQKAVTKKIKLFLFVTFLFICFNQNNRLLSMDQFGTDIINQIFISYVEQNPNATVKDALKILKFIDHKWYQATKDRFNFILNFCKQNRLDITTLKFYQYFEFYQDCLNDQNYNWQDLQNYQNKNYYKDKANIPEDISNLINKDDTSINSLLKYLHDAIEITQNLVQKRIIKALIFNIENLCDIYDLNKGKSLSFYCYPPETFHTIFNGKNPYLSHEAQLEKMNSLLSSILFIGINPNKNIKTNEGLNRILNYAAREKDIPQLTLTLLKYGADPNIQNTDGNTPLYYAAICGSEEMVLILLANNANPDIKNKNNQTVLDQIRDKKIRNILKQVTTPKYSYFPTCTLM